MKNYVKSIKNLTAAEEEFFVFAAQAGDEKAKEMLISSNIRLVSKLAKTLPLNNVVSFEDLLQEGCLAICTAIKTFDATLGYRFTTYATFWIKKALFDCIAKNSTMNISNTNYFKGIHLLKIKNVLEENLHREPSYEEIAVAYTKEKAERISPKQVMNLLAAVSVPASIENMFEERGDCIPDNADPFDAYCVMDRKNSIMDAIDTVLNEREKDVIMMRFGFDDEPMTLEKVGKKFNIEGERVRQIQNKAIIKLSNPTLKRKLEVYL